MILGGGHTVALFVEALCYISQKVAGSILDEVIGFFN
jgi:hypothetical protein